MQTEHLERYPREWVDLDDEPGYFGAENRRSLRVATDEPAVLTMLKPEQRARTRIRIVDASRQGLKLVVPGELMRGAIVQVHVHRFFILAEVRYSMPVDGNFHCGVEIQDIFRLRQAKPPAPPC